MKSINKIFVAGAVALSLGFGATSCVDDLNVTPEYPTAKTWEDVMNDPDQYLPQAFSKCYSCLAVSGQSVLTDSEHQANSSSMYPISGSAQVNVK